MQVSLNQLQEIFDTRQPKLLPTAPLHSEGYEVGGYSDLNIVVGFALDSSGDEDLAHDYLKHQMDLPSELGEKVQDVETFVKLVRAHTPEFIDNFVDQKHDVQLIRDDDEKKVAKIMEADGVEYEQFFEQWFDDDEENSFAVLSCLCRLFQKHGDAINGVGSVIIETNSSVSENDGNETSVDRVLFGVKVGGGMRGSDAAKTVKKVQDVIAELRPYALTMGGEPEIFISGNYESGMCY